VRQVAAGFELRQLRDNALPDGRRIDFEFDDGIEIIPRNAVWRIFWYYGPNQKQITILTMTPHP
jgi:hypothetical protein